MQNNEYLKIGMKFTKKTKKLANLVIKCYFSIKTRKLHLLYPQSSIEYAKNVIQ